MIVASILSHMRTAVILRTTLSDTKLSVYYVGVSLRRKEVRIRVIGTEQDRARKEFGRIRSKSEGNTLSILT